MYMYTVQYEHYMCLDMVHVLYITYCGNPVHTSHVEYTADVHTCAVHIPTHCSSFRSKSIHVYHMICKHVHRMYTLNPNSLDNKGSCWILKDFYCSVTMLTCRELGLCIHVHAGAFGSSGYDSVYMYTCMYLYLNKLKRYSKLHV